MVPLNSLNLLESRSFACGDSLIQDFNLFLKYLISVITVKDDNNKLVNKNLTLLVLPVFQQLI